MSAAEQLALRISALDDVATGRSRFNSDHVAWAVDGREFAHLHDESHIDVRLPPIDQEGFRDDPRLVPRRSPSAWMELHFGMDDVDELAELVALARDRMHRSP